MKRHALITRLWHWTNALAVVVLFMSGLNISNAHRYLYWGDYGFDPADAWLHVIRFPGEQIGKVVETINATGYGLTHGIHTRVDETRDYILERVRAGNTYVNRNQIGAVVGVQPFGGEGLSGTGPKAGGPRYLYRFATERVLSWDVTAAGGNASLMSMGEDH